MKRIQIYASVLVIATIAGLALGRAMLKRPLYYFSSGQVQSVDYWSLFLGNYDLSYSKEFPYEGAVEVKGSFNISLVSSGYVEANGYSNRGKVSEVASLQDEQGELIKVDSLAAIYDYGQRYLLKNGRQGELHIGLFNKTISIKKMMLTTYNEADKWGETVLKNNAEIPIAHFGFSAQALKDAMALTGKE